MNYRILLPYWGNDARYQKLLDEWFVAYRKLCIRQPVTIISDKQTKRGDGLHDWRAYETPEYNPQYQFDHKGDIVCAAIVDIAEPVLVLDTDAVFARDPAPLLESLALVPFAMPEDEGARGRKIRNRHAQEGPIAKRCAGVLWFGTSTNSKIKRSDLVHCYRSSFKELETGKYYEERRLFEQHAWTMVAYYYKAPFLPRSLNWPDHITSVGPSEEAYINHRIGQRKFNVAFKPPVR